MIAIIDYGAGNLTSVERAVQYLGYDGKITADPQTILGAEKDYLSRRGCGASNDG